MGGGNGSYSSQKPFSFSQSLMDLLTHGFVECPQYNFPFPSFLVFSSIFGTKPVHAFSGTLG